MKKYIHILPSWSYHAWQLSNKATSTFFSPYFSIQYTLITVAKFTKYQFPKQQLSKINFLLQPYTLFFFFARTKST